MRGVTVEETPEGDGTAGYRSEAGDRRTLTLRYRWSSHRLGTALVLGFTLAWDAALVVAIRSRDFPLFMVLHLVIGAALSYLTLAALVNRTVVTASRTQISVSSGPLPLVASRRVDARDVVDVASEAVIRETRRGRSISRHALVAVTRSGARVRLCDVFSEPEVPAYLAQRLGLWLGCRLPLPPP